MIQIWVQSNEDTLLYASGRHMPVRIMHRRRQIACHGTHVPEVVHLHTQVYASMMVRIGTACDVFMCAHTCIYWPEHADAHDR